MYTNLLLVFVAIFGIAFVAEPVTSAPQPKCSNEAVREKCIHSLFIIGDNHFPNSTQQLDVFCGKLKETDKCIKDYTKNCMTPMGKRATEVAIAGVARLIKRMCRSADKKKEFIRHSKCGNRALPDMRSCLSDYKMALYGAKQVEVSQKLPILCCKFYDFRGCVRKGFDKLGSEVCPEESRLYYGRIADAFQSDVFDLICSNFEDSSAKCGSVVVPVVKPSAQTKSLIKPLRDVIKSILEESDKE